MRCHQSGILAMNGHTPLSGIARIASSNLSFLRRFIIIMLALQENKSRQGGRSIIGIILSRLLVRFYCKIIIPKSYREEALSDLLMVFNEKPNNFLKDLWEYTRGSLEYRVTQVQEVLIWIAFCVQKSIIKRRTEIELLNQ
jgi:hypothetical protein